MSAPGLIFAAPASGSGKTTLVAGLLRLLRRRGLQISAAKLGPDYIDPAFHTAALGRPCLNIDLWAMRPATVTALRERLSGGGALTVVEGAMGLFDGAADGTASAADFAALTGWPVILVVDARGQAQSAGALLGGFAHHRADVAIAGVIFNRIGGPAHESAAARRPPSPSASPCWAAFPAPRISSCPSAIWAWCRRWNMPISRPSSTAWLTASRRGSTSIGCSISRGRRASRHPPARPSSLLPLGQRIAVACDAAFAFSYAGQLDAWRNSGTEIELFSPLADEAPPAGCDAVYLPGGYPELHAGRLAAGERFLDGLRGAAARGAVLFGECGGYMTLGTGLIDKEGRRHAMAGLLPLESSFAEPHLHLGLSPGRAAGRGALGRHRRFLPRP